MASVQPVILAVDDEAVARDVVAAALGKVGRVISARDGEEALRLLESEKIDVVLTDVRMPGIDGLALADRVRAKFPAVPIAFVSGYLEGQTGAEARRLSQHLIRKPFAVQDLRDRVNQMLVQRMERQVVEARRARTGVEPTAFESRVRTTWNHVALWYELRFGSRPPMSELCEDVVNLLAGIERMRR